MSDRPGEMDERDVDERFASIVAAWDDPLPGGGSEEVDEPPGGHDSATPDEADAAAGQQLDPAPSGDPDAAPDGPGDEQPRAPWVNPSPLDIVVPASTWRVPTTPENAADDRTGSATADGRGDEEHFEPPPVTLPPQEDMHFWGAVVGLVAGPLLLLYVALARPFHSGRWFAAGVVLSLVGFGLLVLRQPRHRDPTDGDDGARV